MSASFSLARFRGARTYLEISGTTDSANTSTPNSEDLLRAYVRMPANAM